MVIMKTGEQLKTSAASKLINHGYKKNPAVTKENTKKTYISKTAHVSETYNLPKFPLKRHLSNVSRNKTLTPSTWAKNRKKHNNSKSAYVSKICYTLKCPL